MALQFILGGAGSGKSWQLYHQLIRRSIAEPEGRFLVIVPEQFTMQTQRDLVLAHERGGISNIDVLSFLRLAYRVFGELGMPERLVLEDTGKNMVLRRLLAGLDQELVYFKNTGKKRGFVEELKSLLTELYQYSVTPERLAEALKGMDRKPLLERKLGDTLLVYQAFQRYKERDGYIVAEEMMDLLCDVLPDSKLVEGSVVCLDGFTGFTPSQNKLLRLLMKKAKDVVITISIDKEEPLDRDTEEFRLFHLSKKTIHKLIEMAEEEQVIVAKHYYTDWKHGHPELRHLGKRLFRYPVVPYRRKPETKKEAGLLLYACRDPRTEAEFVLTEIARLVREEHYRYQDIAVITGDMETYGELLAELFSKNGVFYFLDQKRDIMKNPLVELIRAALAVIEQDFAYEGVMRYLRSGLSGVEEAKADVFENELLARGIRGKRRYREGWYEAEETETEGTEPASEEPTFEEVRRQVVEEVRQTVWQMFAPLLEAFQAEGANGASLTMALYRFLTAHQAEERMEALRQEFEQSGRLLMEKEYAQVYRLVMELLEKLSELLGEEELTIEEYRMILESGFAEEEVGVIPPGFDQVVIGDLERTRLKDIKALFCVGVNEGIVPKSGSTGGILTDMDREFLSGLSIELAPTLRSRNYTEQFYLYLNLTKPEHQLYVSYARTGMDGKSLRPSYLIGKLCQLFPDLTVINREQEGPGLISELRRDGGLDYLLYGLEQKGIQGKLSESEEQTSNSLEQEGWEALWSYYEKHRQEYQAYDYLMRGYRSEILQNRLQKRVAQALYGEITGSVTRLEQFTSCAFAHFLSYGLRLKERKEYTISIPDMGSIFHDAIRRFSEKIKEQGILWSNIEEPERKSLVKESVEEATAEYGNRVLHSSHRLEALIDRVERITDRTVWAICEQVKLGEFEPKEFETTFSLKAIHGRIDRIDTAERERLMEDGTRRREEYVRIIDYKSGGTDFDLNRFYYGLGMQLVVYLRSAIAQEEQENPQKLVIPAGIFYYHIQDPLVEKGSGEDALLKELALHGLVHKDVSVEGMMDRTLVDEVGDPVPSAKSVVIPVAFTKAGVHTSSSRVASEHQMGLLMRHAEGQIKQTEEEILSGMIAVMPYQLGKKTGCDYCEYHSICGFDRRLEGYRNRKLSDLEEQEIWRQLEAEEAGLSEMDAKTEADQE